MHNVMQIVIQNVMKIVMKVILIGNSDCYYGNGAASSDQHCYCYTGTDTGTAAAFPIPLPLRRALITEDDIECTPLEGGDYKVCNANCYEGNPDCYYGTDAALNGEHCYCYNEWCCII
eukprot:545589_1